MAVSIALNLEPQAMGNLDQVQPPLTKEQLGNPVNPVNPGKLDNLDQANLVLQEQVLLPRRTPESIEND